MSDVNGNFKVQLETIESAYEFMLAYAAQGRETDAGAAQSPSIREMLKALHDALRVVAASLSAACTDDDLTDLAHCIDDDANKALVSVAVTLHSPVISSQLVDNLNASIHLRAVLTGLFLADEALKIRIDPTD